MNDDHKNKFKMAEGLIKNQHFCVDEVATWLHPMLHDSSLSKQTVEEALFLLSKGTPFDNVIVMVDKKRWDHYDRLNQKKKRINLQRLTITYSLGKTPKVTFFDE